MKILSLSLLACISLSLFAQEEKVIDGRLFTMQNDVWVEHSLNVVEKTTQQNATFGDKTWQQWYQNPALKPVLELGTNVVFSHEGLVYTVSGNRQEVTFVSLLAPSKAVGPLVSSEASTIGAMVVSSAKVGQGSTSTPHDPGFPSLRQ